MDSLSYTTGSSTVGISDAEVLQILLPFLGFIVAIIAIVTILGIIANWKIFKKAGEKGWKSIIPIYNSYILFKIAGRSFWTWFGLVIAQSVTENIAINTQGGVSMVMSIIGFALSIWIIVEVVRMLDGLSKNFGHTSAFTVGLFFLSTIFMLILAFDGSEYIGNKNEETLVQSE